MLLLWQTFSKASTITGSVISLQKLQSNACCLSFTFYCSQIALSLGYRIFLSLVIYHSHLALFLLGLLYDTKRFIRPPTYMMADLYFTTDSFFYLLSFFAVWSPSTLNGTQLKSATCSEVTAIWKRMSKIWGIPSSCKSGAQKPPFWTTSQLNGNFNGDIFGMTNGQVRWQLQGVSYIVPKR